jgi:hypothetical protein
MVMHTNIGARGSVMRVAMGVIVPMIVSVTVQGVIVRHGAQFSAAAD